MFVAKVISKIVVDDDGNSYTSLLVVEGPAKVGPSFRICWNMYVHSSGFAYMRMSGKLGPQTYMN